MKTKLYDPIVTSEPRMDPYQVGYEAHCDGIFEPPRLRGETLQLWLAGWDDAAADQRLAEEAEARRRKSRLTNLRRT